MIYADASFLVALVVESDDHWPMAWHWWRQTKSPTIVVSRLTLFEAQNTIRGWAVAKKCRPAEVRAALEGLYRAQLEGVVVRRHVPEQRLYPDAARLSEHHTTTCNYGALDILHVATATNLHAITFLSFDERQRSLAKAEGLVVTP